MGILGIGKNSISFEVPLRPGNTEEIINFSSNSLNLSSSNILNNELLRAEKRVS